MLKMIHVTENDDDDNDDNILHPKILNNYHLPLYIVIHDQQHQCCQYKGLGDAVAHGCKEINLGQ